MKVINKYPNYTIPAKPITTSSYTPSYYYNDSDYWFGTKKPIKKEPLPTTRWYFAYGSNMSRKRISSRGVFWKHSITGVLPDYELNFNKKAGVTGQGYANITPKKGSSVEGILYKCEDLEDARTLDGFEGCPDHYERSEIIVKTKHGNDVKAFVYIANKKQIGTNLKPSKTYLSYLLDGKRFLSKSYYKTLKNWEPAKKIGDQELRVFVYGTLKQGHGNHRLVKGAKSIQPAIMSGRLYSNGLPYVHVDICNEWIEGSRSVSEDYAEQEILQADIDKGHSLTDPWSEEDIVIGELCTFKNWDQITALDSLEGFRPNNPSSLYRRILTSCVIDDKNEKEVSCWVYVVDEKERGLTKADRVESGEYEPYESKYSFKSLPYDSYSTTDYLNDEFQETQRFLDSEPTDSQLKEEEDYYNSFYQDEIPF
tara:strand:+ start:4077 stop:5348 length:1272 start_codon:yes stop_codon:yes gene_type:complete